MADTGSEIIEFMKSVGDSERARLCQRFFKTGPGEYGEGDIFLGVDMPTVRKHAKSYLYLDHEQLLILLRSGFHEVRMLALIILVLKFKRANADIREEIFNLYMKNTQFINNWDLVDSSAYYIVGPYLEGQNNEILMQLAHSDSIWERRIAIIATLHFIRIRNFDPTLHISEILLNDSEDLIHKAVGWMLREVGNRHLQTETSFLDLHASNMPRTMLRYAIEKFPEQLRKHYLLSSSK